MKKLNFKNFFLNHVEKMVFGIFALIVLVILGKTSWSRYPQRPDELLSNISKAKQKIESSDNVWSERDSFKIVDYSDKVNRLFSPMSADPYDFSTVLFHPLYKKNEPRREPTYEPVLELQAIASLVPLSMAKASDTTTDTARPQDNTEPEKQDKDSDNEFGSRNDLAINTPLGSRPGQNSLGGPVGSPGISMRGRGGLAIGQNEDEEREYLRGGGSGGVPGAAAYNPNVTSRGVRVVAVRGVFPVKQQIDHYRRAMHLSEAEAAALLEVTDFVLERQTAVAGPDPWKAGKEERKWETLNIDSALEVLDETSGVDPLDPVPIPMQDAVITMNLPLRLAGFWGKSATHPKIKSEELELQEAAKQDKLLSTLAETFGESDLEEAPKPRRKGFTRSQTDIKSIAKQVKSNEKANARLQKRMGRPETDAEQKNPMAVGQGAMGGRVTSPVDQLLGDTKYFLFRYFDFDVQSGYVYRYRVRLKLRNPNFEATDEQLAAADPNLKRGEERDTPWSNISQPVEVPKTFNYFLKDVERDPYREEKVKATTGKPVAQLAVYDWDLQLGTTVSDTLNTYAIGTFIAGEPAAPPKNETLVLNLAEPPTQQLQKKKHSFTSLDVLLDVEPDTEISPDQHPDLKSPSEKGRGGARLGLMEEALVYTSVGEVKVIDQVSERTNEEYWRNRVTEERKGKEVAKPNSSGSSLVDDDGVSQRRSRRPNIGRGRARGRGMRGGGGGRQSDS